METLVLSCRELEESLFQVQDRCKVLVSAIEEFNTYVGSHAVNRLRVKLMKLALWVVETSRWLYLGHKLQGYVFVYLSEKDGTGIRWVEREKTVANREFYRSWGFIILSVEEAVDLIIKLTDELAAGNFLEAIDWINKYGRSPGLDFSEIEPILAADDCGTK